MTQSSRPQANNLANHPAPSDPGPYSADQWAQIFQIFFTSDQQASQGPFIRYLNELECADNGSTTVTVDTGAGVVNGHILISSEQETFAIPAGPVAGRTDRVVMVENNTNTEVTQTTAGRPLLFPNDLSEYTGTPGVPPYSARLAIVRGADGAGTPAIDQTNTLYMVELYRYDINNVPTISNATDYREFAYFASTVGDRHFLVSAQLARNETDAQIEYRGTTLSGFYGVRLQDNKVYYSYLSFIVPDDFYRNMTIYGVFIPNAGGNLYGAVRALYGQCAENAQIHTHLPALSAVAVTAGLNNCIFALPLTNATIGDIVKVVIIRDSTNVLDTVNDIVYFDGVLVEYEAKS